MEWKMALNGERITNEDRDQPVTVFIANGSNHISYCKKTEYFDKKISLEICFRKATLFVQLFFNICYKGLVPIKSI